MELSMKKCGLFGVYDSGAPESSHEYPTLVLIHGFGWHSGTFSRLVPLVEKRNARIVLINRRDYPGSVHYDKDELEEISSMDSNTQEPLAAIERYMKKRALELYNFFETFIKNEKISEKSGLTVAGWSFGSSWITALLTYAPNFPIQDIPVIQYIRRLVIYDPPYHVLGYPPPKAFYFPTSDQSHEWLSGYYFHGAFSSELEYRTALLNPRPTSATMSAEELGSALFHSPTNPSGSDAILISCGIKHGLYEKLRKVALYPDAPTSTNSSLQNWNDVGLRYIWCDHSNWAMPWGKREFHSEVEEAKQQGRKVREVEFVQLKRANHFAHWDQPEICLQALLEDNVAETFEVVTS